MEVRRQTIQSPDAFRRTMVLMVAASFVAFILVNVVYADGNILESPFSVTVTAGIAVASSVLMVSRQKTKGLYGKTYAALAMGLWCWFAGELIYTYDVVIAGVTPSGLSLAEAPWLALYAFFGYYVFKTYQFFGYSVKRTHFVSVLAGVSVMMAMTTSSILSSVGNAIGAEPLLVIRLLYPIGDAILIAPSVLLLLTLRRGLLTYTPWLFISTGLILIAAADIAFANNSLIEKVDLSAIIFPLYNAGNLTFVAALLWQGRFGLYDRRKAMTAFQQSNK